MSDHFRRPITPKGPTADSSAKASAGMKAAMRAMGAPVGPQNVGGTPITNHPLPSPTMPQKPAAPAPPPPPSAPQPQVESKPQADPSLALGQPHVTSYQALVANDKLAKPTIRAWDK